MDGEVRVKFKAMDNIGQVGKEKDEHGRRGSLSNHLRF